MAGTPLVDIRTQFAAVVGGVWPDIVDAAPPAGGIYWPHEISNILFGPQKTPPFAVVDPSLRGEMSGRFGATTMSYLGPVRIYRVDKNDYDSEAFLLRIDEMVDFLLTHTFGLGQRLSPPTPHFSPNDSWLGHYFLNNRKPYLCAYVEFDYELSFRATP